MLIHKFIKITLILCLIVIAGCQRNNLTSEQKTELMAQQSRENHELIMTMISKTDLSENSNGISAQRDSKTQDGVNFCLTVIPGDIIHKTFALVTITNMTDKNIVIPTPDVMPLAGTIGYKNTIEITDKNGDKLDMSGMHADYGARPRTTLNAFNERYTLHSKSWLFELEDNFPALSEPGEYTIHFCLLSALLDQLDDSWKGQVDLSVTITKEYPYKIEPKPIK